MIRITGLYTLLLQTPHPAYFAREMVTSPQQPASRLRPDSRRGEAGSGKKEVAMIYVLIALALTIGLGCLQLWIDHVRGYPHCGVVG